MIAVKHALLILLFLVRSATSEEQAPPQKECPGGECPDVFEAIVGNLPVIVFPTVNILERTVKPPVTSDAIGEIPAHLQYTISLDQAGVIDPDTGMGTGDPEAAVVFSLGKFYVEKTGLFSRNVTMQTFNRCRGEFWLLYWEDITDFGNGKGTGDTGKEFVTRINENEGKYCTLTFEWNNDMTSAKITGYFAERLRFLPGFMGDGVVTLSIELLPYWKWKFGMKVSKRQAKKAAKIDEKCCPPTTIKGSCLGQGTLGKPNTPCETISMACGDITTEENFPISECAMWVRKNKVAGLIGLPNYFVYPIGDKNGEPTNFNPYFQEVLASGGIKNVFHGLAEKEDLAAKEE